jgi:predicted membrane protein
MVPPTMTNANLRRLRGAAAVNTIYRGCMGKLLLVVLAVIAAFMVLSIVVSALHFIFWVAVVALIVVVGMRLTGGARRRSRQ